MKYVNSHIETICDQIKKSLLVKEAMLEDETLLASILSVSNCCLKSLNSGGKIIFAGNGGSFADAQHLSAEFISKFLFDRPPLASVALATNNSAISAIGNDYGYDQVFAREIMALAKPEDTFIAITTSGNSPNILSAVRAALELKVPTYGLTGSTGGEAKGFV